MKKRIIFLIAALAGILYFQDRSLIVNAGTIDNIKPEEVRLGAEATSGAAITEFSCGEYAIEAGNYIITSDRTGIKAKSYMDNSEKTLVFADDFNGGSLASDGNILYYTCSGSGINLIYLNEEKHEVLTETNENPCLLAGTGKYLYYTDENSESGFTVQNLNIFDLEKGQVIKTIANVNNVKIFGEKIYYHIARFDPEPVRFFTADLNGKHKKRITKKYCDSFLYEDGMYYLEFANQQKLRLIKSGLKGEDKEKQGRNFKADLVIRMGKDYIYYIRTINEKNYLYAYKTSTGASSSLNSTDGYFSVLESDEGILYLRNTKTGLLFILDGINFSPTMTQIKGNVNILGIFQGSVYYSVMDKEGNLQVKMTAMQ